MADESLALFYGVRRPKRKMFSFPRASLRTVAWCIFSFSLSHFLPPSLPSLFTLLSFSLWEQMEYILCYISALSALRKYYNKADMPRVRTDLVCQWHVFEFVNCSVLQPCQRASFIVSGPVNTIHPWGLPAEKWNNEWKALRFLKWTRLKGQELSNWLNTVSLNNISNYYYYYF